MHKGIQKKYSEDAKTIFYLSYYMDMGWNKKKIEKHSLKIPINLFRKKKYQ